MMENASPKKASFTRPLIFILLVVVLFITARVFNLQEYVQEERLRSFVAAYGMWGPLIYLLIWTIAPCLFLPGLPITLAGGLLFEPFWGVVYTVIGATTGASTSFLVSRYLARDWVATKISGSKLSHLDDKVAQHGWKIVAFTRLVPVLPFFVLNYAFGLTRIPFVPYAVATFFAQLPWIIAFVLISGNILQLLQGKVSIWLIIGVILVALVSLLSVVLRRIKGRPGESVEL